MLKPTPLREIKGDRPRIWMLDDYFDLIIWFQPDGTIYGFQLCYDKAEEERVLTWIHTGSFTHAKIDSGETGPLDAKCTPMLISGGAFDYEAIRNQFIPSSTLIDPIYRELVLSKLTEAHLVNLPRREGSQLYIQQNGFELGPFSEKEIIDQIRYAGLPDSQLIRCADESSWRPLRELFPDQFSRKSGAPKP